MHGIAERIDKEPLRVMPLIPKLEPSKRLLCPELLQHIEYLDGQL